ncbi:MAG: T9SS type A sorting domain-containing protein [Crocinitomicaceae bacterium]|nr:T9SS type A sorting domain-containing protein [Crocinitomicaceae bacterium]
MKTKLLMSALIIGGCAIAQNTSEVDVPSSTTITVNELGQTVTKSQAVSFRITPPLSEWGTLEEMDPSEIGKKVRNDFDREGYLEAQNEIVKDPVVQTEMGSRKMRSPLQNWVGQSGSGYPPDPSGAAGPDHYVQAVNTVYRVYSKTGGSLTGSASLSSLWPGSQNAGDPIVMYDRHADRWFISQFKSNPNGILIAISTTNDPTGSYYEYSFNLSQFPDYPKYSIWWDGYYMTSNSSHTAVVFERDKMLAGDASADMISLSLPSLGNGGFRSPLPADSDGPLPPNGTPCYFFNLEDNAFGGVSQDQIEIYEMNTNWSNGTATVSSSQQLSVPTFDAVFSGGFANISQPGTNQKLDAIQGVLMYRAQYMRWVGYNTVVLTHAVDLGSNRSGVRWYELRDADDGNWTVHQSGTYAPDNTASRFMSSAAMDAQGNIGLAYSKCDGTSIYPGIYYTGRLSGDALGQMTFGEIEAISGSGSQTVTDRFGDYAHLSLDPDGKTLWHTGEYLGNNGGVRTRIFSFDLEIEAGIQDNPFYENLEMNVSQDNDQLTVSVDGVHGEGDVQVELIGMDGKVIQSITTKPIGQSLEESFNVASLQSAIYFVRVGNVNFQKAARIMITK